MFKDFKELIMATERDIKALNEATKKVTADTMAIREKKYRPFRDFIDEVRAMAKEADIECICIPMPEVLRPITEIRVTTYSSDMIMEGGLCRTYLYTRLKYEDSIVHSDRKSIDRITDNWADCSDEAERLAMEEFTRRMAERVRNAQAELESAVQKNKEA